MKTKLLTLALFGLMSLSFMACSEEEIVPVNDTSIEQVKSDCQCDGGLSERERPDPGQ
jgi:hypothetical protein